MGGSVWIVYELTKPQKIKPQTHVPHTFRDPKLRLSDDLQFS